MPTPLKQPVLIVGAGPTGLNLAIWLTRLGIPVRVIDKLAEAGTTSRALAVQARTLEFYRILGFADEVVNGGVKISHINLWVHRRKAARLFMRDAGASLSPFPYPLVFPQDAHERLLIAKLESLGVRVERQVELARFEDLGDAVRAVLRHPDGREETCLAPYLAGCDGASSTVRHGLKIGFPGGTYEGLFYVADVKAAGPATDSDLHVDLDAADLLIVFPLQGTGNVRLVGSVSEVKGKDTKELTFDDVSSRAIENLKLKIEAVNWFSTYAVHHRAAERFRVGRVFLLGDAAHIHSPAGGQGMNTGIGDAVNLAWKLAAVLHGKAAPWILDTYEFERIAFARRLVATTDQAFRLATASGRLARLVRTRLVPRLLPLAFKFTSLRRLLFRTVSQINIRYRDSALSVGAIGTVRAGDRLPWVEAAQGEDNFEPLKALDWQVQVHGTATPEFAKACDDVGVPLQVLAWSVAASNAGLRRDLAYAVRPDGYIGWEGKASAAASSSLREYFVRLRGQSPG